MGDHYQGTINDSYFDSDLSGTIQGIGNDASVTGLNKTTAELQTPTAYGTGTALYATWNVDVSGDGNADDPWDFGTSSEYPVLNGIDANGDGTVSDADLAKQRAAFPVAAVLDLSVGTVMQTGLWH